MFQPVVATDDFQMFRSLMVQKNMELQLQALRVLKETNGTVPNIQTHTHTLAYFVLIVCVGGLDG